VSACTYDLRAANKPYPRTCAECGLGPCKRYSPTAASGLPAFPPGAVVPVAKGDVVVFPAPDAPGALGVTLDEATQIILNPPGNKPWPYRHFTVEQVKEIGAIVSEWLKVKLATIQTDSVDELAEKNRALVDIVGELRKEVAELRKEIDRVDRAKPNSPCCN
jgi:hypothetical protein